MTPHNIFHFTVYSVVLFNNVFSRIIQDVKLWFGTPFGFGCTCGPDHWLGVVALCHKVVTKLQFKGYTNGFTCFAGFE
jgi:hypothetical protein